MYHNVQFFDVICTKVTFQERLFLNDQIRMTMMTIRTATLLIAMSMRTMMTKYDNENYAHNDDDDNDNDDDDDYDKV